MSSLTSVANDGSGNSQATGGPQIFNTQPIPAGRATLDIPPALDDPTNIKKTTLHLDGDVARSIFKMLYERPVAMGIAKSESVDPQDPKVKDVQLSGPGISCQRMISSAAFHNQIFIKPNKTKVKPVKLSWEYLCFLEISEKGEVSFVPLHLGQIQDIGLEQNDYK